MRSRVARVSLLLLAAISILSAAYFFSSAETRSQSMVERARTLDTRLATAIRQTFDLRSAQQGYVSQGQNEKFWIAKVAAAHTTLSESLVAIQGETTAAASRVAIEGARNALEEFERMDRRAREYVLLGQKLLASDLIFSDGLETTEEVITALEQTRYVESADASTARTAARRRQLTLTAAAAAVTLLVLILLAPAPSLRTGMSSASARAVPVPDRRQELSGTSAAEAESDDIPALEDVPAFEFRPVGRVEPAAPAFDASPVTEANPPAASEPPANDSIASAAPTPDLSPEIETIAEVCRELARLSDTAALPALLHRAATALDASGVMLWVTDPDARELTAIAAHGYPGNIISRMGTIPRDAENVTAAAFRTGLLQTFRADDTSSGAIAAPLINPSGCIGVMSAEVNHEGERQPAKLALATIVAAQLATLVAPATRAQSKSEAL